MSELSPGKKRHLEDPYLRTEAYCRSRLCMLEMCQSQSTQKGEVMLFESGTVKFFDEQKRYGFIVSKGRDVFFHMNNGWHAEPGEEDVRLVPGARGFPDRGDTILFRRTNEIGSTRASMWAFKQQYFHAKQGVIEVPCDGVALLDEWPAPVKS